jgi:hypothetical protein
LFQRELGHGSGDGVVETSVQRAKVLEADRRSHFQRELRDGLTDISVVVDDLVDAEPLLQQIMAVPFRALANVAGLIGAIA